MYLKYLRTIVLCFIFIDLFYLILCFQSITWYYNVIYWQHESFEAFRFKNAFIQEQNNKKAHN